MNTLSGKTVLVTGGTGSFGRYVTKRLLDSGAREIRIFSRDEKKQFDMQHKFSGDPRLVFHLGDIRDARALRSAMAGVEVVFQAAALKQVPHCERFPAEAVATNVEGARNVVEAALDARVEALITISTDKAVQPVNVMGMTKALQEKIVINAQHSPRNAGTRFVCVRYGNVLNSRGSVVPLFRAFLARKKPITITSEGMTRFLLTLTQAVDLVMYAYERAQGGELLVRKARSARILDLARAVCDMAGAPFEYKVIGLFPGEKLHEILVSEEERTRCVERDDYFVISPWEQRATLAATAPVAEYSSRDVLEPLAQVREMIERSDREEAGMDFEEGIFTR